MGGMRAAGDAALPDRRRGRMGGHWTLVSELALGEIKLRFSQAQNSSPGVWSGLVGYCLDVYHDRAPPPRFLISKSANGGADGGCNGASAGPPTFPSPLFLPLRPACAFGSPSLRRSVAIKAFRSASAVAALYRGEGRGGEERDRERSGQWEARTGRLDIA